MKLFGTGMGLLGGGIDPQHLELFKQARKKLGRGMTPEIMKTTVKQQSVSRETSPRGPSVFTRMANGV
jgi:hypothetical protein